MTIATIEQARTALASVSLSTPEDVALPIADEVRKFANDMLADLDVIWEDKREYRELLRTCQAIAGLHLRGLLGPSS